ncbi:HET-C-related protein [Pseudomonas sp. TWI628]|uniref:HET-C-related protein n=1 Tax=Pseudomonas sp. TWI628 TaxID=3136788 RepID=UPI003209295D
MNDQQPDDLSFSSTFALEQLGKLASSIDLQLFTHLFRPVFGSRLPPALFIHLQRQLLAKTFNNPSYQISSNITEPCTYQRESRLILVQRESITQAMQHPAQTARLMLALLQSFALHIHNLLLQGAAAEDASDLAPAMPTEVSKAFVQTLLFYNEPIAVGSAFATFNEAGTEHSLILGPPERPLHRQKRFASGRGHGHTSFGHESIEDALEIVGFNEDQRKAIYFGNWLRDYSQMIDPAIVHPEQDAAIDVAEILQAIASRQIPRVSRVKLTAIVDLFALKEFHSLQQTPEDRDRYRVTPKLLGVYRAHEHIDNPTKLDRQAIDPRRIDPDFAAPVFPEDKLNGVLPKRSMKRYMRRSIAYMIKQLEAAKKEGMTAKGMRLFGEALHVLEDYYAHSNFVELSLKRLGYDEVLPWTTRVESRAVSRHEWPVITGMFGTLDIVGSVSDPLANLLFGNDASPAQQPGDRSDFDNVMLILLKDEDPLLVKAYERYLTARDNLRSNELYQWLNHVTGAVELPLKAIDYACNLIRKPLLKWAGDHIATLQIHLDGDPNNDADVMATHSHLAKDHDTHPFHSLAVRLAALAVKDVGQAMFNHWMGLGTEQGDPRILAERFIVHPNDTDWFMEAVADWARGNPDKIEQGKSIETLRQLQRKELDDALKDIQEALDSAINHVKEIEELTDTSFWSIVNLPDAGPAPWQ